MLSWHVVDLDGKQVNITLPGYHIPTAEVRLLSPQLLLAQYGGYSHQTARKIQIHLNSGEVMEASYCNRTRLPTLSTCGNTAGESFWAKAFDFTTNDARAFPLLLSDSNVNLNASQKELLLWHQKLSHDSISWIQLLMRDRKWLRDRSDSEISLHSGPFLPCRSKCQTCDIDGLKCISCICAKAHRRPVQTRRDPDNLLRFSHQLDGRVAPILKRDHIAPGDCISTDHYLSPINGRLYTSFGREQRGYSCGTIFVDHSSGKVFNYPQLSTTAADTICSKHILERLA